MKLKIINSDKELDELIAHCKTTKWASFDFETSGLKYYSDSEYPLICGVSFQPGSSWIIPMGHKDSIWKDSWQKRWRKFGREVLGDRSIIKVAWNFKFEYKWCIRLGTIPQGYLFDAMLAKYLLDEERPHDLKDFVVQNFPKYGGYEFAIGKGVAWADKDFNELSKYCGIDCDLTGRAMIYLERRLMDRGFYNLFRNMYCSLVKVFSEAEYSGIAVDRPYLEQKVKEYAIKIAISEKGLHDLKSVRKFESLQRTHLLSELIRGIKLEIRKITQEAAPNADRLIANREAKIKRIQEGQFTTKEKYEGLNFNSPPQLGEFLFTSEHGLKLKIKNTTAAGKPSTDEATLIELEKKDKTGFMTKLMAHRTLTKLNSTYIEGMVPHLDVYDRVHAGFKLNGTVTSRLSCLGKGTLIKTKNGDIPIENFCSKQQKKDYRGMGIKVLTHKNRMQELQWAINNGEQELYEVELESGHKIKCTLDHKFLTPNNGWLTLKEIYDTNDSISIYGN